MGQKILISGRLISGDAVKLMQDHQLTVIASDPDHHGTDLPTLIRETEPDGIIIRTGSLSADTIHATPSLKVIAKHGVGVDMIDLDAASARAIPVMITPGTNARSVAEHTLALLLSVMKDIPGLDRRLNQGQWEKASHRGVELSAKHVGLIGFGAIAQEFASMLGAFGVGLTALTRRLPDNAEMFKNVAFTNDLNTLLNQCDVISMHCPLTDDTRALLGAEEFAQVKPGAFIINTARGGLIDEDALLTALETGNVRGAGLDCFVSEPPSPTSKLLAHPRVVATPHIAWATEEAANNMGVITAQNIITCLNGERPPSTHIANFDALK